MPINETTTADAVSALAQMPASDVKKRGWRRVMRTVAAQGPVLVTNHSEPEAVIVSAQEYARLLAIERGVEARAVSELEVLQKQFDSRLAALDRPDASARLRAVVGGPATLKGKVKAGTGH